VWRDPIPAVLNVIGLGVTLGVNTWISFYSAYEISFNARC